MSSNKFSVSVIIPTRNEEDVIEECLDSVYSQTEKPFEVMVVDGFSTDKTKEKAQKYPIRLILEKKPSSLPNARNLGIANAKGDIILIIDADVILDKNCIENALHYFNDPATVAVIPSEKTVVHTRLEKIQFEWIAGTANSVRLGLGISSFAEFFRKEVFSKILFDPELGYGEDSDFQERLKKLCLGSSKIIRDQKTSFISVHHPHTLSELWSQWTWYGRTFKKFLKKNRSLRIFLNLGSLLFPVAIVALLVLGLIYPVALILSMIFFSMLVLRNLVACYRSKSFHLLDFLFYEFSRSLFLTIGLSQGLFSKQKGK